MLQRILNLVDWLLLLLANNLQVGKKLYIIRLNHIIGLAISDVILGYGILKKGEPHALENKQDLIKEFQIHEMILVLRSTNNYLTKRINYLTEHLKVHKKDHHSRRGLLKW